MHIHSRSETTVISRELILLRILLAGAPLPSHLTFLNFSMILLFNIEIAELFDS
jgi:hypothetical protein